MSELQKKLQELFNSKVDQGSTFEASGEEGKWVGQEVATNADDAVPLVDPGTGKTLVLRIFQFAFNPEFLLKKNQVVNKQDIFNSHWHQMRIELWKDGLVPREDVDPRVVLGRKGYRIFILSEPRLRTTVVEKPQTLQEITKPKRR